MKIKDISPFVKNGSISDVKYVRNRNYNRTLKKVFEKYYRIKRNSKTKVIADYLTAEEVKPYHQAALYYNPDKDTGLTSIFNFLTHRIKITVRSDRNTDSLDGIWKVEMVFNEHKDVFGWEEVYTDLVKLIEGKTDTYVKVNSVCELQEVLNKIYRKTSISYHKCLHKVDKVTKHKHRKGKHRKFRDLSILDHGKVV